MHSAPMKDSDGIFSPTKEAVGVACRKCGLETVGYEIWESRCGGYEDYRYTCKACGHYWWVEGIDS